MSNETIPAGVDQILNAYLGSSPATPVEVRPTSFYQQSTDAGAGGVDVSTPVKQSATIMDYTKEFVASAADSVGSIGQFFGEGAALVANKATNTEDYVGKNLLKPTSDAIRGTMTEGGKQAGKAANVEGSVVDLFTGKAKLPETVDGWLMMGANGLGSLVPMLIPVAGWVSKAAEAEKLAVAAVKIASASGLAADITKAAELTQAAKAASLTGKAVGATMEGSMTGGAAAGDVRGTAEKSVAAMTHEQLMAQVPVYSETFKQTGDQDRARKAVVNGSARWAAGLSAVAGAAGGAMNAKVLEDFLVHKGVSSIVGSTTASRLGRGAISAVGGAAAEGGQEVAEKIGQNAGENIGLGKDMGDNVLRDTAGDFLGGAMVGGGLGGVGGLTTRHNPTSTEPPIVAPTNPLIDQLAAANGPLSRATVASNPDLKPAAPAVADLNPLDQRVSDLSDLLRDGPVLSHLQSAGQTDTATDLLSALAFAKNTNLSSQARQQAVNYLTEQLGGLQAGLMPAESIQNTSQAGEFIDDSAINNVANNGQQAALVQPVPPQVTENTPFTTPIPGLVQVETQNATQNIAKGSMNTPAEAAIEPTSQTTVQAPKLTTPPGAGTAQMRLRKAQLKAMAADGFDTVERRPDGGFVLINPRRNEAMVLTGMGDAQLARKAIADYIEGAAHQAASSPQNTLSLPTDKQIEAENYKKGHLIINGMDVSIENPRHATRSGVGPDGKRWSSVMAHHYGYFRRTEGADGDALDVFIGSRPDSDKVFVIDQNHADGSFDEHKVMMGFTNEEAARAGYLANYDKGWPGLGAITPMTVQQFKAWAKSDAALKPAAGYDANSTQGNAHDGRGTEATGNAAARLAGGHLGGSNSQSAAGDQGSEFGQVHGAVPHSDAAREGGPGRDSQDGGGTSQKNGSGLAGHAGDAGQTAYTQGVVKHSGRRDGDGGTQYNNDGLAQGREIFARHQRHLEGSIADAAILASKIAQLPELNPPPAAEMAAFSALTASWSSQFGDAPVGYWDSRAGASDGVSAGGRTFINLVNPQMNILWTIGHEFEHLSEKLATQGRDAAMLRLRDHLWSLINEAGRQAYYENYLHKLDGLKLKDATPGQLRHLKQEMLADFMGKRFTDKDWLQNLADTKPALFGAFIKEWLSMLSGLIRSLRGTVGLNQDSPKNVDKYIRDLEKAKALATEVAIAWAERHPKLASQTGVDEVLHSRYAEFEFGQEETSFDDFDLNNEDLQAEMEAEMAEQQAKIQARLSPPQLEVTDAEIKQAGLMAEDAFSDLNWQHDPDARGMQQTVEVESPYQPGKMDKVSMNLDRSGLWSVDLRGTWVGPAMNESDGYATEAAVKLFTKRQLAAIDLKEREFDLTSTSGKALQKRLVDGWKSIQHASARKFGRTGRTAQSLKDIAGDMGLLDKYDVTVHQEILDAHNSVQSVTFKHKESGVAANALLAQHNAGGKKFLTANTAEMGKGGLGAAFYQMAAEYAARRNMTLRPEPFLSGINSYRRTEQQLSAALRTGKSNVMVPHPVQRVYGFEDDASRIEQHNANLARLILAGIRNARELVPGFDELRYNPATGKFTDTTGKAKDADVMRTLKDVDARAFGMGRGTLARSVLSHMVQLDEIKLQEGMVFAEPVLYSERVRDEVAGDALRTNIVYEVAPDPHNAIVAQAWNQLSTEQRLVASEAVTHVITPKVLVALGASGKQTTQVGSYLEETNTSFALALDRGDALSVSHALGYVLSQDSMVVLSSEPFHGGDAAWVVDIHVGDKSTEEIDAIYQQLRAIKVGEEQPIGGQSTADGIMSVLNFSNINNDELSQLIDATLGGAYDVLGHQIYAAFPQKQDYNYDLPTSNPRGNQSPLWQALNPLRRDAASLIQHYLDRHARGSDRSEHQHRSRTPQVYQRRLGDGQGLGLRLANGRAIDGLAAFLLDDASAHALNQAGKATPELFEIDPTRHAGDFAEAIAGSLDGNRYAASVYIYGADEYAAMRLFLADGGRTGFALKGDDVVSVFNYDPANKGAVDTILGLAIHLGGRRLDAFDTVLPHLYSEHGFQAVARTAWNDDYAPAGWDKSVYQRHNGGEPDVVFMAYNKNSTADYQPGDGILFEGDDAYDKAVSIQQGAVERWSGNPPQDINHSIRAPLFYSELMRQIEQASMKQAPAGAWKSHIKALSQKGVKADEIEWSGVNEWLDLQEGKVSRQALTDYLNANGVQVQETVLGGALEVYEKSPGRWYVRGQENAGFSQTEAAAQELAAQPGMDEAAGTTTKYSQYQLPGGENYREVLLTLPVKNVEVKSDGFGGYMTIAENGQARYGATPEEALGAGAFQKGAYRSNHWDTPNVLAHIRVNDRTDADGKRVLFVEEIQSDWGQDGKKKGFARTEPVEAYAVYVDGNPAGTYTTQQAANEHVERALKYNPPEAVEIKPEMLERRFEGLPRAPFVGKTDAWLSLALKRVIKMAVDGGYDKVAFVNGEQSADRYDLSKQVDFVSMQKLDGDYSITAFKENRELASHKVKNESEAADVVGKEVAAKLFKEFADPRNGGIAEVSGDGLKVGGEGMKAFYDKIVPNTAKEVIRKLGGGQMEVISIGESNGGKYVVVLPDKSIARDSVGEITFDSKAKAVANATKRNRLESGHTVSEAPVQGGNQPGFTLTDAMRQKYATGLPLFSKRSLDDLEAEQDHQDAAPKTPKTRLYAGKKVDIPVKIEDTGEIATLIMDVNLTLDDFDERQANMRELLGCLK